MASLLPSVPAMRPLVLAFRCLLLALLPPVATAQPGIPLILLDRIQAKADAQAVPDTTPPWRYFPMHIGDEWEYRGEYGYTQVRIEGDTVLLGRRFFKHVTRYYDTQGKAVINARPLVRFVRYDTTSHRALTYHRDANTGAEAEQLGVTELCRFDAPFEEEIPCGMSSRARTRAVEAALLFDRGPGLPPDTVRTRLKLYQYAIDVAYAPGIGLVLYQPDGPADVLRYYRVGGVERGRRFVVAAEAEPRVKASSLRAWPNPFRERLHVEVSAGALVSGTAATIEVFDALGRRVHRTLLDPGASLAALDTYRLAPGPYVVRWTQGAQQIAIPVVRLP
jgi:hypothetical protein